MSKKENYYIDNDVFFDEMVEWKNKVIEADILRFTVEST